MIPGADRARAVPGHRARDPVGAGRAQACLERSRSSPSATSSGGNIRYPPLGMVTANELHVPVSEPLRTYTHFSHVALRRHRSQFLGARLAGKTDLIPNRVNHMWIDPHRTGLYVGQCAQYCGTQHAKMLLRVYVDSSRRVRPMGRSSRSSRRSQDRAAAQGPAGFRNHGLRQLPHRFGNAGGRALRSRPHSSDEPRHHRRGRRAEYPRESARLDSESRLDQAGFADAGHAVERSGSGRSHCAISRPSK